MRDIRTNQPSHDRLNQYELQNGGGQENATEKNAFPILKKARSLSERITRGNWEKTTEIRFSLGNGNKKGLQSMVIKKKKKRVPCAKEVRAEEEIKEEVLQRGNADRREKCGPHQQNRCLDPPQMCVLRTQRHKGKQLHSGEKYRKTWGRGRPSRACCYKHRKGQEGT